MEEEEMEVMEVMEVGEMVEEVMGEQEEVEGVGVVDLEVEVVEEDNYRGEGEVGSHCDCHRIL